MFSICAKWSKIGKKIANENNAGIAWERENKLLDLDYTDIKPVGKGSDEMLKILDAICMDNICSVTKKNYFEN